MADESTRMWTNHAGGYVVCSHVGCQKKAASTISGHDCCGRCNEGRNCMRQALVDYDGPGSFPHGYFETVLEPGTCNVCGEPPESH